MGGREGRKVKLRDVSEILNGRWSCTVICWSCVWSDRVFRWEHCVFGWEELALQGYGLKKYIFVNQSNVNNPDFELSWIGIKYFRQFFHEKKILWLKLTVQSYLRIRLKIAIVFNHTVVYFGVFHGYWRYFIYFPHSP